MKLTIFWGSFLILVAFIEIVQPLCVLESDFGFKINCAFKKAGLFRVRNLGGIKAHASLGFSLGDELGFEQSLTNQDPSRRRSVSVKNGAPPNLLTNPSPRPTARQEKRGKQNRIMMRPMPQPSRPNQAAMDRLTSLHRRPTTMQPIIVPPTIEAPSRPAPAVTMAKPMPMGVPAFKPVPPKDDSLTVVPIATKNTYSPLQIPQAKGPGMAYQNPVPHQIHDVASYTYNTKKVDDYNSITGYGDDTTLKFNKEDINSKIAEIAKAGNISMDAVEAAIALRQQQLLNKYANIPVPTTTSTTTTTEQPLVFQPEPEPEILVASPPQKSTRVPTSGKVMNAPREYYPVGYEKNFDDHFQSKVDLPDTSFYCGDQKYFPGLYGDESLGCMVFHVCALTDDGLVMKSFLCPESTLFDQTILKCNWWFYVDCKNTRKLYETNIPVSKSYQLMKALTFFSSYKKEMEDGRQTNPEDVDGVKEAISIIQNQDTASPTEVVEGTNTVQIVTPQPIVDERTNHKPEAHISPVYRANRNYNFNAHNITQPTESNNDTKLITVNADLSFKQNQSSTENVSDNSREKIHRRRMVLKTNNSTRVGTTPSTDITSTSTTTTPSVEILKQTQPLQALHMRKEKLTDLIEALEIDAEELKKLKDLPPVKRFYRSSAESGFKDRDIAIVNNEKIQIVRPTVMAKVVGEYATPKAAIAQLDQAILGNHKSRTERERIPNQT